MYLSASLGRAMSRLVLAAAIAGQIHAMGALRLKQLVLWQGGTPWNQDGLVVCGDVNSNGLPDFTSFMTVVSRTTPMVWEVWECRGFNRYEMVHADTSYYPFPSGIQTGSLAPFATGDLDRDGLPELWGIAYEGLSGGDWHVVLLCLESPTQGECPSRVAWSDRIATSRGRGSQLWTTDLDSDGRMEILLAGYYPDGCWASIHENRGNDSFEFVWADSARGGYYCATGDFDLDGRGDFATLFGHMKVYECTGDNEYRLVFAEGAQPNALGEVWSGRDANRNGKPEVFTVSYRYLGLGGWRLYLYCWEADADNHYRATLVDSVNRGVNNLGYHNSACGDIDGDGVDEVLWSTGTDVAIYKGLQQGKLNLVYNLRPWRADSLHFDYLCVAVHDMNLNGYNEIILGGGGRTGIWEVEAVQVLSPSGGETYGTGDTCRISWQTFDPPRCDSVSLFLRRDSTYRLDTIVTGLAPADTPYLWVAPDIRAESAWVMAIAYGPGWQYDECDSAIRILGTPGVEESPRRIYQTRLEVWPNPARGRVNIEYELARAGPVELSVLDATGRKVAVLASGRHEPGRYSVPLLPGMLSTESCMLSSGVYFVRLVADGQRIVRKVVVQ